MHEQITCKSLRNMNTSNDSRHGYA